MVTISLRWSRYTGYLLHQGYISTRLEVLMNTINFAEIFDAVQMDENAKKVFLAMGRDEQLLAILGMQAWMRNEIASVNKRVIDVERSLRTKRGTGYREDDAKLSTSEKVMAVLTKRLDFWIDILKNVLSNVFVIIVLAVLYLAFGGKMP